MFLDDQHLCIHTSSSFVYGAMPIGASIYVVGDLDTGEKENCCTLDFLFLLRNLNLFVLLFVRNELRLHPRVPPPHRDVAPHQAHAVQRPLQNDLRRPPHGQLPTVPPAAQPGHVPDQSVRRCAGSPAPPSCCFWHRRHWLVSCMTWPDGRGLVYILIFIGFWGFYGFKRSVF